MILSIYWQQKDFMASNIFYAIAICFQSFYILIQLQDHIGHIYVLYMA